MIAGKDGLRSCGAAKLDRLRSCFGAAKKAKGREGSAYGGGACARRVPEMDDQGLTQPRGAGRQGAVAMQGQTMAFVHPLARGAKVWTAKGHDDREQRILVIVTTIPLDPGQKGYKKSLVEKLSRAAREHLANSKDAESFMLINRLRDWKLPEP